MMEGAREHALTNQLESEYCYYDAKKNRIIQSIEIAYFIYKFMNEIQCPKIYMVCLH